MSAQNLPDLSVESNAFHKRFMLRLFVASLVFLTVMLGAFSYFALNVFEEAFVPELERKAKLIGEKVSRDISKAVGYGIPLTKLGGMEIYLNELVKDNPDIAGIIVLKETGEEDGDDEENGATEALKEIVLYRSTFGNYDLSNAEHNERLTSEIRHNGRSIAEVRVRARPDHLISQLKAVSYDVATALLIALLVTFELLSFFVYGRIFGPLDVVDKVLSSGAKGKFHHTVHSRAISELERIEVGLNDYLYKISERIRDVMDGARELRAAQITAAAAEKIDKLIDDFQAKFTAGTPYAFKDMPSDNVRILRFPLFLFMFAEELSRAFLPILAQQYQTVSWLADQPKLAAGLPIAVFMGVLAIISLISGHWIERLGAKRMFVLGVIPAVIGYLGVFWAWDYSSFLISRVATAVGYALVFVSCQGYVAAHSTPSTRASNMAIFVGAVLVAGVCGPAIGGILADQIGYGSTFMVSALFAAIALIVLMVSMEADDVSIYQKDAETGSVKLSFDILLNKRFAILSLLCAIPSKMMLTGIIFLLTPLYLINLDVGDASIGRIVMIYGIAVVFLMPRIAAVADKRQSHLQMVIIGGVVAGLGGLILLGAQGFWPMAAVVLMVGVGQALSISPQLALVQGIFASENSKFSVATGMGVFRSVERIGSVIGPLLAGTLAAMFTIEIAIGIIGAIGLAGAILYWLISRLWQSEG